MRNAWKMKSKINPQADILPEYKSNHANIPRFRKEADMETIAMAKASGMSWKQRSSKKIRMGTYYHTMSYILKALRLVGCLPMSIDDQMGTVEFRVFSLPMAFTVFIYSLWSLLVWFVVEDRFRILENSTDSFDESLMAYIFIIYFWEWPLVPFIRWFWQTPRLLSFLAKWKNFEDHYERVTSVSMAKEQQTNRNIVVSIVYCIPWVCTALIFLANFIMPKMRPFHLVAYWYIAVEMFFNTTLAWATSQALISASKGLVQGLRRDAARENSEKLSQRSRTRNWTQEYMMLWRKLCIIVRKSGSGVIGPSFALNMGKEFPNMLLAAYGVIAWLDGNAKWNESGPLLILLHHLFDLIVLGNTAHMASESAGGDIRDELTLMMVKPRTSKRVKKEIRDFLQMMDATPPYISIGEYVTVNKEFVSQLLGTIVTYVVVLLQFRHSMDPHHTPMLLNQSNEIKNISQESELYPLNYTNSTFSTY